MASIHAHIEKNRNKTLTFLQSLIRIATVNPPGQRYEQCVDVLERRLRSLGMQTRVVRVPDSLVARTLPDSAGFPRLNLIGRWDVGAPKTLHFNAHYDVVPVSGKWKHGPFNPVIEKPWIYGRGSSDMKGSIASLCAALQAVRDCRVTPKVNIEVSFTADEEVGGELGAGYIVRQGLVKPDFAIECEGGCQGKIGYGHNGLLWFRVNLQGRAAHAATPEKGVNAFEGAAWIVQELQGLKKILARRSFRPLGGKVMHPSINIGGVFGVGPGPKANIVPAQAWFTIDRRVLPNEDLKNAQREMLGALKSARAGATRVGMKVDIFQRIDPCVSDTHSPFHRQFAQAVRSVRGITPKWVVVKGFTDQHWFGQDLGIPSLGYGPDGKGAHGMNEKAKIQDLYSVARIYATLMEKFDGDSRLAFTRKVRKSR